MHRFVLSGFLLLLISSSAPCEEYLIRVEGVGYQDVPVSEKVPEETSIYSTEVVAIPNQPFRSRTRIGPETLILEGKLKPQADGRVSVQIRFCREVDTGDTIPKPDGSQEPVLGVCSTGCEITIGLDREVSLGGSETQEESRTADKISRVKSKWQHVLTVSRKRTDSQN